MNEDNAGTDGSAVMTGQDGSAPPLQAEIQTAHVALKTALLQLGLLSRFQRDVRTLGVQDYASKPPTNLTHALTQALRAYNDACNSMELQIMRAKAALLYEPSGEVGPQREEHAISDEKAEAVDPKVAQAARAQSVDASMAEGLDDQQPRDLDESMAQPEGQEVGLPSNQPEEPAVSVPLQTASSSNSLLNIDEMEDLFGPGTSRTDTSTSTPANGGSLQAQQAQAEVTHLQSGDNQAAPLSADLTMPMPENSNTSVGGSSALPQAFDQTSSMFDFGNNSDANAGTSGLPDTNFDFSHMTQDDFNSLLASIGDPSMTGVQSDSSTGLGQGFNLDLSAFLNTDINPNQ